MARYLASDTMHRIGIMFESLKAFVNAYKRKPATATVITDVVLATRMPGAAISNPIAGNKILALAFVLLQRSASAPPTSTPIIDAVYR